MFKKALSELVQQFYSCYRNC